MTKQELMDTNYNKQDFQELIEKYLDGKLSLEKVKLLVNYYNSFKQENEWVEELGPEDSIKNRMLINILEAIQEEEPKESKIIKLFKNNIFRYGVAAAVLLFVFFNAFYNEHNLSKQISPKMDVVENNIEIGTDKATLTREDGTTIVLERGKSFTSKNVVSNGEKLTYSKGNESKAEIVYNYLTIPRGGQFSIKLSDGTQVWLNSESKLKFPVSFKDGESRQVELMYGEAYFDVSPSTMHKGSRFKVLTGTQNIEVLGTEFNVKAYRDENAVYTTLVEGTVSLSNKGVTKKLTPGDQSKLDYKSNNIVITTVDVYNEVSWKEGVFSFDKMPLKDIMKVLSRWYDVKIIFSTKSTENITFNGILDKNQKIEEILSIISNTNNVPYEINQKTIIFK